MSKEEIHVRDGPPIAILIHVLLKFGCLLSELIQSDMSFLSALKPAGRWAEGTPVAESFVLAGSWVMTAMALQNQDIIKFAL